MDGGAWCATVHGISKSWTQLSTLTFTFHFHALEKEMATLSSIFAWRIPRTEEPGAAVCGAAQSQARLKRLSSSSSNFDIWYPATWCFFLRGECDANKVLTFWGPGLSLLVKWSALEICGSRKILCQGGTFLYGQKGFVILIL